MIVNGRKIRDEIQASLKDVVRILTPAPTLVLVYVGEDPVIEMFIRIKERFGKAIGVNIRVERFSAAANEIELSEKIDQLAADDVANGIVVQLPLPERLDTSRVLDCIPVDKDPDILSASAYEQFRVGESRIIPPVAGAVAEIFARHEIDPTGKRVVVVGEGQLVGRPVTDWLRLQGVEPIVLNERDDLETHTETADIIISGAGDPHIIRPNMVKPGVVLIDCGTSSSVGGVQGDIHPDCASRASLFSPVPGGVGPVTVAKLFENLITLSNDK